MQDKLHDINETGAQITFQIKYRIELFFKIKYRIELLHQVNFTIGTFVIKCANVWIYM